MVCTFFFINLNLSCDSFIEWCDKIQRSAIVRRFCIMNGVQIVLKVNFKFITIFTPSIELPIRFHQSKVAGAIHGG